MSEALRVVSEPEGGVGRFDVDRLFQGTRLHRDAHTSPEVFEREMRLIFERTWVFVGAETEISQPGDYKTTTIGRYPVILARDKAGDVQVMVNRCRHRGALVCREARGNSSAFKCFYHGWTYGTDGRLLGVPFPGGYGGLDKIDKEALGLQHAARVDSYRGLIFASMAEDVIDLADHLGRARTYLDLIIDASPEGRLLVTHGAARYAMDANWKLQMENFLDSYHPIFTHQSAFELIQERKGYNPGKRASTEGVASKSVALPGGHAVCVYTGVGRGYASRGVDEGYRQRLEDIHGPERTEEVLNADVQVVIFPNLFFQNARNHLRVVRPVSPNRTEVSAYSYSLDGAPDEQNRVQVRALPWWASAAGLGQPDDLEAFNSCQAGLAAPSPEWLMVDRGLDREVEGEEGEIIGDITDEGMIRNMYRHWASFLREEEER